MIQSFQRSHAIKPESGFLSDWIGNSTDMICVVPIGQNAAIG